MDYSKLFDSHTHFHPNMGEGQHFILSGYSAKSNSEVLQKISTFKRANFSLGIGPQEIQREELYPDFGEAMEELILQILKQRDNPQFVAIGEVGLDNHWGKTTENRFCQFEAFEKMIQLSKKTAKPLVIHSRDAEKECIQLLLASDCKKVMMHCFGGTLEQAKTCVNAGFFVSIPPVRHKERKKIIREIDLQYLLVESDAPYLGKKSTDAYKSAEMVAEYKDIPIEKVLDATFENAKNLFKIG